MNPPYYCYTWVSSVAGGFDILARQLSYALSFFNPMVLAARQLFTTSPFSSTSNYPRQVAVAGLAAWDGVLDDSTSVSSPARMAGTVYPPAASLLPASRMTSGGSSTPVRLLSHSCNFSTSFLPGQPLTFGMSLPPFMELWNSAMDIADDIQTCFRACVR